MIKDKNISEDDDVNMFLRGFRAQGDKTTSGNRNYISSIDEDTQVKLNEAAMRWMVIPERAEYLYWTLMTTTLIMYYLLVVPIRLGFESTTQLWSQDHEKCVPEN